MFNNNCSVYLLFMDRKTKKEKKSLKDGEYLEKLQELRDFLCQYEDERNRNGENVNNILKTYDTLKRELKKENYLKEMLISIYKTALQDTEREIDIIRKALTIIQDIHIVNYAKMSSKGGEKLSEGSRKKALMKVIYESGASLPLWIASSNEPPPPLCGAIPAAPNYVAKDGDMVAALVRVSENEENWILAEVLGYDQDTGQYRVDDIDEEEQSEHVLDHERVIPLPHYRADPCEQPDALFKHFTLVLALYPHTTCFYRALVYEIPEKPEDPYRILFEDRSYDSGYSPAENIFQRYVLNFKGEESDALNN